jgi:hypothetical protein
LHGLEQRRLGLWCGPVDLVGEQQIGEYGPGSVLEGSTAGLVLGENLGADNVRRHQVRRELDSSEVNADRVREGFDQFGFSQPGNTFEKDVPLGEKTDERLADEVVLSKDPEPNSIFDGGGRGGVLVDLDGLWLGSDGALLG